MKTTLIILGLIVILLLAFGPQPWEIDEHGANVFPKKRGNPLELMAVGLVLGLVHVWWVLFGWWMEKLGVGHVAQYQDAGGKWHYGRDPLKPRGMARLKAWLRAR